MAMWLYVHTYYIITRCTVATSQKAFSTTTSTHTIHTMFINKSTQQLRECCILLPCGDDGDATQDVECVKVGMVYATYMGVGDYHIGEELEIQQAPCETTRQLMMNAMLDG